MEKTYTAKTPLGDFKVTTLENQLLSKQAVTSKGIPIPYTNLQLNPYPIPNWICSVVTISPCNTQLQYVTNQLHRSQYVTLITN